MPKKRLDVNKHVQQNTFLFNLLKIEKYYFFFKVVNLVIYALWFVTSILFVYFKTKLCIRLTNQIALTQQYEVSFS